ncbi:MAG: MBL fold metallo-hydrolase [candidate division WOR-3 bacterium]
MRVFKKFLPSSNIYLLTLKKHAVLFDTGDPHSKNLVLKFLRENMSDKKLLYIFITHFHWDHAGNVYLLKKIFSPFVVISNNEKEWAFKGYIDLPNPKGTLYSKILWNFLNFFSKFEKIKSFEPDKIVYNNEVINLDGFNIEIFQTPGHTPGSLTFKVNKYAFIGDTLLGPNIFLKRPRISMFIHEREKIYKSIEFLKEIDVDIYFPGHGMPFKKEDIYKL